MTRDAVRWWAGFLAGAALGAGAVFARSVHQVEQLTTSSRYWQGQAQHWQEEWNKLQDELSRVNLLASRQTYVQTVDVVVLKSPVGRDAVESALRPYTNAILGMALSGLRLDMVYRLFDGRVLAIGDQLYRVEVRGLLVGPKTQLLVEIVPVSTSQRS